MNDEQWKVFWLINDNYPEYVSETPEKHLELINMLMAFKNKPSVSTD